MWTRTTKSLPLSLCSGIIKLNAEEVRLCESSGTRLDYKLSVDQATTWSGIFFNSFSNMFLTPCYTGFQ